MKNLLKINNNYVMKKTGDSWSNILNIKIVKPKGWTSEKDFLSVKITREEFLERAANSEIAPSNNISRRDAAKMLKKLNYD